MAASHFERKLLNNLFPYKVVFCDLRTSVLDIRAQQVLTKDSVSIEVDGVVFTRITDPMAAVIQIANRAFR